MLKKKAERGVESESSTYFQQILLHLKTEKSQGKQFIRRPLI
jgi:hypothetical protein